MKKLSITFYTVALLAVSLYGCTKPNGHGHKRRNLTPYGIIHYSETIQGEITAGWIRITTQGKYNVPYESVKLVKSKGSNAFVIEQLLSSHRALKIYRLQGASDVLLMSGIRGRFELGKNRESVFPESVPTNYYTNDFAGIHKSFVISDTFQGTMNVFVNGHALHYKQREDIPFSGRSLAYGKKLADELKALRITYMGKTQTQPVGEKEPVVIDHNSSANSIQKLMQAAKAVQDPRLLVIERKSGTGDVNITVFGEETASRTVTTGIAFVWKFGKEELKKLRQFVVID